MKNLRNTKINDPKDKQKHPASKYILENILLNIFKFYILKYIIKFLQSHDNNNKKKIQLSLFRGTPVNHLRWNDVPRTSRIFCLKITIFSQF